MGEIRIYLSKTKKVFRKLKVQLYLGYMVISAVISTLIFSVILSRVRKITASQIGKSRLDVLKQISEWSNSVKDSTIMISDLYRYNQTVHDCLTGEVVGEKSRRHLDGLKNIYDRVFYDVGLSRDVVIVGNDGLRCSLSGEKSHDLEGLKNQLWFQKNYDAQGDIILVSSSRGKFDRAN